MIEVVLLLANFKTLCCVNIILIIAKLVVYFSDTSDSFISGKDSQTDYWLLGGVAGMAGIALLASILTYLACRKKQKREDVPLNNLGPSVRIRYPRENNSDYYND